MIAATAHVRFHESDFPIPNQIFEPELRKSGGETGVYSPFIRQLRFWPQPS